MNPTPLKVINDRAVFLIVTIKSLLGQKLKCIFFSPHTTESRCSERCILNRDVIIWAVNPVSKERVNDFSDGVVSLTLNQTLKAFSSPPLCSPRAVLSHNHRNRWAVPLDLCPSVCSCYAVY